jgi:hypothetical protein
MKETAEITGVSVTAAKALLFPRRWALRKEESIAVENKRARTNGQLYIFDAVAAEDASMDDLLCFAVNGPMATVGCRGRIN